MISYYFKTYLLKRKKTIKYNNEVKLNNESAFIKRISNPMYFAKLHTSFIAGQGVWRSDKASD